MLSTRRFFASIIPAVPFMKPTIESMNTTSKTAGLSAPNYGLAGAAMNKAQAGVIFNQVMPPAMKQYMAAQEVLYGASRYRSQMREMVGYNCVDLNIASLKSVSAQHKIHMHIKMEEDKRKQERSFLESLAESLGLTDFLKKRHSLDGAASGPG